MSKVERPYSPSTHVPEPEVEQPMGVKARVLGTLLHPQLYARFLPRSIILKLTLIFSPVLGLFLLVCLADVVATLSLFIPFHYVPSIASDRGLTRTQGAMLISATGVCSTAGQCLFLNGTQSFLTLFFLDRQGGGWMDLRSQLAPSHLHRQPLHRHRSRPSLLPRLLHHLPCLHRLHKFVRLADRLLDRSHVSHLCPPPRPPASLPCILLPHSGQRTRHTFGTSTGRRSCGQISGQVMDAMINLYNPDFYSPSPDLQQSIWRLQLCFWQPFSFLLQTS